VANLSGDILRLGIMKRKIQCERLTKEYEI
jgi:hypothetical protein